MPKISVIMPVFNTKEEYLRAARKYLSSNFHNFEFIEIYNSKEI